MATVKVSEDNRNTLVCTLCQDEFRSPRLLPCFHTFCEDCLSNHIIGQTKDGMCGTFNCPLCKMVISPPGKSDTVYQWSASFPLNDLMISVMDSSAKSTPDNKVCDLCSRSDESNAATFWCEQCRETLCEMCHKYHSRMKWQSTHNTVPIENLPEVMENKTESLPGVTCPRHVGKEMEVFCFDHQEICCTLCVALDHRKCKEIEIVENTAVKFMQRNNSENILGNFDQIKNHILKIVEEKQNNKTTIEGQSLKILSEIDNSANKAKRKIDSLRDALKDSCKTFLEQHTTSLSNSSKSATRFLSNIGNCQKLVEVALRHGSTKDSFILYDRLCKQMMMHFSQMKEEISDDKVFYLIYKDEDLESQFKTLGNVEASTSRKQLVPETLDSVTKIMELMNRKPPPEGQSAQVPMTNDSITTPVVHVKTITEADIGKGKLDLTCGLYIKDEHILLSDFTNKRLLLLNKNLKCIREIYLRIKPLDIRTGDTEHELYVAGHFPSTVLCLDMQNSFKVKKTIEIEGEVCGIDVFEGFIYAVIGGVGVKKMSSDGVVALTFRGKGWGRYVRVSPKQRKIYHTDGDTIVCRSLDGIVMFKYENPSLAMPRGLCLDAKGNLYICGNDFGNVHQISADGKKSRVLIEQLRHIPSPWGLLFHPEKKTLMVIAEDGCNEVAFEIYKFVK